MLKERTREMDLFNWIESLGQDLRYAARMLWRSPGFTAVTILTLALGIGANTAVFSAMQAVVLRPLAYPHSERVMHLFASWPGGFGNMPYPDYVALRERNQSFEDVAACESWGAVSLTGVDRPMQLRTTFVTPNYLELLGAHPVNGRLFTADEDKGEGGHPLLILNFGAWQRFFGGDRGIVGRAIELNRTPYTVIGVMSAEFHGTGEVESPPPDVYLPISMAHALLGQPPQTDQAYSIYWGLGLLKQGVSVQQARDDLAGISRQLEKEQPNTHRAHLLKVQPVVEYANGQFHKPLLLLIVGASLILLIGCVNIANSLIARLVLRRREMAVRRAVGASVSRLSRQIFVECGLLAFTGGSAGLLLAVWLTAILSRRIQEKVSPFIAVHTDGWVLLFSFALCVGTTLGLALLLIWDVRRITIFEALAQSGRPGMSARIGFVRRALVVAEVGFSLVLLIGAGLMLRSFKNLTGGGLGFRTDHLLTFRLSLRGAKFVDAADRVHFVEGLVEKARVLPGIDSVSILGPAMLGNATWVMSVFPVEKQPTGPQDFVQTFRHSISPDTLSHLGISLIRGREFNRFDAAQTPLVAIISESVANQFWPNVNPLGKQLKRPDPTLPPLTVVGVAADARHRQRYSLLDVAYDLPLGGLGPQRDIYLPYAQRPNQDVTVAIRTQGETRTASDSVASAIASLDSDLPVNDMRLLDDRLAEQNQAPAAIGTLMDIYALLALFMAALGVYAVVAQSVNQRTKEIGIRVALGAQRDDILKMVVREGMTLIGFGIVGGLVSAWCLTRLMSSLLYGVSSTDALTFGSVVPVLSIIALAACWIPARRATRVDPMVALRNE